MKKKRDSIKVRKPRKTTVENKTVLIRETPPHAIKEEDAYLNMQKKVCSRPKKIRGKKR